MAEFNESYDWVVVGSGAGSFVSALVMRKAGKSVLKKHPLLAARRQNPAV
jgi:choline dehydrogenase-like flavoprotein